MTDSDPGPDSNEPGRSSEGCRDSERPRGRHRHHRRHGRKGRILHTRVSEELSEDIRRLAEDLRVPASNLVRNVLEDVFSVVEQVSEDVGEVLEDVLGEAGEARERLVRRARDRRSARADGDREARRSRSRSRTRGYSADLGDAEDAQGVADAEFAEAPATERRERLEFDDVFGWQPLVLNRAADCSGCGRHLARGASAHLGVKAAGLSDVALCSDCLSAL